MSKVNLGGREFTLKPLNLRVIRSLMVSGKFDKLQSIATLKQEEQLDIMVAFIAASTGAEESFLWDNLSFEDVQHLPEVFNQILTNSGFMEKSKTGEEVSR